MLPLINSLVRIHTRLLKNQTVRCCSAGRLRKFYIYNLFFLEFVMHT